MQYIDQGPDIPEELMQAHEEGRVVFFCGAGISYPAGLPGFEKLVEDIYAQLGESRDGSEEIAFQSKKFDTVLNLLENRVDGYREKMRKELMTILKPTTSKKAHQKIHSALLKLAENRDGKTRLITTNFDRIFEATIASKKLKVHSDAAPMLPIPKETKWDGIVYLHGLLPEEYDEIKLDRLVLTSGDFGTAYLTERWASRFISEVFRSYMVCFIGYSINDSVLQYLLDALAADRIQGENLPETYVFASYDKGNKDEERINWKAKSVNPILYEIQSTGNPHAKLQKTLKVWADIYNDGIIGKERIIANYANNRFVNSIGEVNKGLLWAISDKSGSPAEYFANFKPAPDLRWLIEVFSQYDNNGLKCSDNQSKEIPIYTAVSQDILDNSIDDNKNKEKYRKLSNAIRHLDVWIAKNHLDKPELAIWLANQTGYIRKSLLSTIEAYLFTLDPQNKENKSDKTLTLLMNKIWRIFLSGRIKSHDGYANRSLSLYGWNEEFLKVGKLTSDLKLAFKEHLKPQVAIRKPTSMMYNKVGKSEEIKYLNQIIRWEIVLANSRHSILDSVEKIGEKNLSLLLFDFQQLLQDALDLFYDLGKETNSEKLDASFYHLRSITPHWQNRGYNSWVVLIELLRDAWNEIRKKDKDKAEKIAHQWFDLPYFTFKRLALYAASHKNCVKPEDWINWLLKDNAKLLYSVPIKRETLRLLASRNKNLPKKCQSKLENAILSVSKQDKTSEDYFIWLYLSKLKGKKNSLGTRASKKLHKLSKKYPNWVIDREHQLDEFSSWTVMTGDPGADKHFYREQIPEDLPTLIKWLKTKIDQKQSSDNHIYDWSNYCNQNITNSYKALQKVINEIGYNPTLEDWLSNFFWAIATQADEEELRANIISLIQRLPSDVFSRLVKPIALFVRSYAGSTNKKQEKSLLGICNRILKVNHESLLPDDTFANASNHPIAYTTEALLNSYFKYKRKDDKFLPNDFRDFFTNIGDVSNESFRSGRAILASRLVSLYIIDPEWTREHLFPLFDWSKDKAEARLAWLGFLLAPRIYAPILVELKKEIFSTVEFYDYLEEHNFQFAHFFTYMALEHRDGSTPEDYKEAFKSFSNDALMQSIIAVEQALEGAGKQKNNYYKNRVKPFLKTIWPKEKGKTSEDISGQLASLCISSENNFMDALDIISGSLMPTEDSNDIIIKIVNSKIIKPKFCEKIIDLLDAIVIEKNLWSARELRKCLEEIAEKHPKSKNNRKYRKLLSYTR